MSIEATEISAFSAPPPRKTEPEKSDESFDRHLAEAIDEPAPANESKAPVRDTASEETVKETVNKAEADATPAEPDSVATDTPGKEQEAVPETAAPAVPATPQVVVQDTPDAAPAAPDTPAPEKPAVAAPSAPDGNIQEAANTNVVAAAATGTQTQQPAEKRADPAASADGSENQATATPTADDAVAAAANQATQTFAPQPAAQNARAKPANAAATPAPPSTGGQNTGGQNTLVSQVGREVSHLLGNDGDAAVPQVEPDAPETVVSNAATARSSRASATAAATANPTAATAATANPAAVPAAGPQAGGEPAVPAQAAPPPTGNAGQRVNPAALPPVDATAETPVLPPVGANSQPAAAQTAAVQSAAASQQAAAHQPAAQQVAVQIAKAADDGVDRIRIQLNPAELGRVDVRLEVGHDGRVQAVVTADRAETLDMLRRDVAGLEKALAEAGLKADTGGLNFSLRGDGDPGGFAGGDDGFGSPGNGAEDDGPAPDIIAQGGRMIAADGALDIRV